MCLDGVENYPVVSGSDALAMAADWAEGEANYANGLRTCGEYGVAGDGARRWEQHLGPCSNGWIGI